MPPLVKEPAKALDLFTASACAGVPETNGPAQGMVCGRQCVLAAPACPADVKGHCDEGDRAGGPAARNTLSAKPSCLQLAFIGCSVGSV